MGSNGHETEGLTSKSTNCKTSIRKGDHENQISLGGEADLQKHRNNCKKNPGHPNFIPIESFSVKHLPEGLQNIDLCELIKASADLTVKLSVRMTSPDRPEFWPKTDIPYFLYDLRCEKILRTGTGMVRQLWKFTEEQKHVDYGACPCYLCNDSANPSKVWWEIHVDTAAHVVVDDVEASHTSLTFFYDREDSDVVTIKVKACVKYVNIDEDKCRFICVTCDWNLGNKLEKMRERFVDVWWKVFNKYKPSRDIHRLSFIVSHPHGCSKQVSVGQWKDKLQVGDNKEDYIKFIYTTCTCPGSSGAYVHCVGYNGWYYDHVHSGSLKIGINYSGNGFLLR